MNSRLILVGGFLGAGKTTLLSEAARLLATRGERVGLITNDQAPELVDTVLLAQGNQSVEEVSGSCFCCNFPGLLNAIAKLQVETGADVLIAEPVGSCTDLSATIVQPLRDLHRSELDVAPLSVLADPNRLADILNGGFGGLHPSAAYIFRKQLEEADFLVITKTDLVSPEELTNLKQRVAMSLPLAEVFTVSTISGEGIETWLDAVMVRTDAGQRLAEVDYDIYAEGEAVLGWLNATFDLQGVDVDWNAFARDLLSYLSDRFDSRSASVGHVKLVLSSSGESLVANLTGRRESLSVRGSIAGGTSAKLTLNARVEMSPDEVESIVREAIDESTSGRIGVEVLAFRCLSPGRPMPTHRYDRLIALS